MLSIHLQESLLGEVNRVRVVDNQRSSGVTVAGSEPVLVRSLDRERRVSTNRRYHTFRKIGPSLHQSPAPKTEGPSTILETIQRLLTSGTNLVERLPHMSECPVNDSSSTCCLEPYPGLMKPQQH